MLAVSNLSSCGTQTQKDSSTSLAGGKGLEEKIKSSLSRVAPLLSSSCNSMRLDNVAQQVRSLLTQGSTETKAGADGPLDSVYVIKSTTAEFFFPLFGMEGVIKPPKAIYPSFRLIFQKEKDWDFIYGTPSALITLDDPHTSLNSPRMERAAKQAWRERVIRGNTLHKRLWEEGLEVEGVHLASPLYQETDFESMVFTQPWYPSNLEKAANSVPCSIQEEFNYIGSKLCFERKDIYRILYGIATTLDWMHKRNVVHRDVKASNIFLDFKEGGLMEGDRIVGLLGDCEWLKEDFGYDEKGFMHPYPIWDVCAVCNISTPFVDLYGLLVLLARFVDGISLDRCVEIRDETITNLISKKELKIETENVFEKALFSINYLSAFTLIFILEKSGIKLDEAYKAERMKLLNAELSDTQLCLKILQEEVEAQKQKFTHAAVVMAMRVAKEFLQEKIRENFVGSVDDALRLIKKEWFTLEKRD